MKQLRISILMLMTISYAANAAWDIQISNPVNNSTLFMYGSGPLTIPITWHVENTEALIWKVKVYCDDYPTGTLNNLVDEIDNATGGSVNVNLGIGPDGYRNYRVWATLEGRTSYFGENDLEKKTASNLFTIWAAVHINLYNSHGGLKMGVDGSDYTLPETGLTDLGVEKCNHVLMAYAEQLSTENKKHFLFSRWSGGNSNLSTYTYTPSEGSSYSAFYTPNPLKPTGVTLSSSVGEHGPIKVSWTANTDSVDQYEVSRKVMSYPGVWQVVATTSDLEWTDPNYLYCPGGGQFTASYRIRAIYTSYNAYSESSDPASVQAEEWKIGNSAEIGENFSVASETPLSHSLEQNYPNPFNPSTTISYAVPQDGPVTLKVYDMAGHEVASLVDGYKSAGQYNVKFDASKLSSGIYLYKIQAGTYSATKKMQLLK